MNPTRFSRRAFIKLGSATLFLAGCSPKLDQELGLPTAEAVNLLATETASPKRPVSPTPPPSADGIVQLYLQAWARADFKTMYSLLSPESQGRISFFDFQGLYNHARILTTAGQIETQIQSLLAEETRAIATFSSRWATTLFGPIEANHSMQLRFDQGRWLVVWEPTLVIPQLGHGLVLAFLEERPQRGIIYDRNDQALASYKQLVTIGLVPNQIADEEQVVEQLSQIIPMTPDLIRQEIAQARPDWFVPLADMDFEDSVQYHDTVLALAGVQRRARPVRTYTSGVSGAHIMGTMGVIPADRLDSYKIQGYQGDEIIGLSGVEGWGEPFLAGRRGGRLVTLSGGNKVVSEIAAAPTRPGGNIYLSLDISLQQRVETILGPRRGAVVVMEPTGWVRALASYPRYLPEDFATGIDVKTWSNLLADDNRPLVNRPTQGLYPPASVFKIISAAAAVENLGYSGETPFYCSGQWHGLGENFVKKCWLETGHGYINLQDGITQSCDVVFYEIGLALHREDPTWLPAMARAFGLGQLTGLLGLDELAGVVPDNEWKLAARQEPFFDGDAVNMAIGQGDILTSPLQIARLLAVMATDGLLYQPQLVRRISSRDSGDQFFEPQQSGQLPLSPQTLAMINQALWSVVHGLGGTARHVFVDWAYTAAGKTGTAETVVDDPHAWFAGYAPADEPEVVVAVLLEHAGEGSEQAAPVFKAVVNAYFELAAARTS